MTATPHLRALETPATQDSGRKPYSDEFRSNAVGMVRGGQPIAQTARDLGVARNTLKAWMDAVPPVMSPVGSALAGSRREMLDGLRERVIALIEGGISGRDMPVNARLLMEIGREIEAIDARAQIEADQAATTDEPFDPASI